VIKISGSVSAKTGAKSIIDSKGVTLYGWVGGGCAEEAVREAALESLRDGQTRIVPLDLDDEILGVGMPCGGTMEVYVEPYKPRPELMIIGHGRIAEVLAQLAHTVHFSITVNDSGASREAFPMAEHLITSDLDFSKMQVGPQTYVVVVTQHKGDQHSIKKALEGDGPYIGLVASTKRAKLVFEYLLDEGVSPEDLKRVHSPAGLDFAGTTPEEIALSIVGEMVAIRRGGSGKSMMKLKQVFP
jgi:xanthine dehydrogenase accessory factor